MRGQINAFEVEQSLLGALLLKNVKWKEIRDDLLLEDFYYPEHALIFKHIQAKALLNQPFDMLVLSDELKAKGEIDKVRGEYYLFELARNTPCADNIKAYAEKVKDYSLKRQVAAVLENCLEKLNSHSLLEVVSELKEKLNQIEKGTATDELTKACLFYEELRHTEIKPKTPLLPWFCQGGIGMIYAERGLGKTQFALSLAYALTSLDNFMNWKVLNNTGVLYVDGEMSLYDIRERLEGFVTDCPRSPLILLSHEKFYEQYERDLVITESETQADLLDYLDKNSSVGLVILDNLSSLTRIREDKSDDWRSFMLPFLIACRRRNVAVLMVHHAGKNKEQRGTGAREDHLDVSIHLAKVDDENKGAKFSVLNVN